VRNRASGAAKDGEEVDNGREASRLSFALNEAMSAFRQRYLSEGRDSTAEGDTERAGDVQSESVRPKKKATGSTTETPSMQH
jgi:hypothetical protein